MKYLLPEFLWLAMALPLQVAAYLWLLHRRRKRTLRYSHGTLVRQAIEPQVPWRRHVPPALLMLATTVMLVSAARPASMLLLSMEQQTVILAVDVSGSMLASDVSPTRLKACQQAARDFVDAYNGDAGALERLNRHYGRSFSIDDVKAEIWRRDYAYRQRSFKGPQIYFPIEEAQIIIAQDAGFGSWEKLMEALAHGAPPQGAPYAIDSKDNRIAPRRRLSATSAFSRLKCGRGRSDRSACSGATPAACAEAMRWSWVKCRPRAESTTEGSVPDAASRASSRRASFVSPALTS